jgi:hypothetical protein
MIDLQRIIVEQNYQLLLDATFDDLTHIGGLEYVLYALQSNGVSDETIVQIAEHHLADDDELSRLCKLLQL